MSNPSSKTLLVVGGLIFGLVVIYFIASYAIPRALITLTKAAPVSKVSISGSYIIGSKILARADGKDTCVVNVFLVDDTGKGVPGKIVEMTGVDGITSTDSQTDSTGKMTFEITSLKEQQLELSATVDGVQLPKKIKVTFRNEL